MGRHYAEGKHESSAWLKGRMLEAFRSMAVQRLSKLPVRAPDPAAARLMPAESWSWSDLREEVQARSCSGTELSELPQPPLPLAAPYSAHFDGRIFVLYVPT